eukprot:s1740_g15.t1
MALNGDGLGLLWSEPLKVTVEGDSRRGEGVLSPIGPSVWSSALVNRAKKTGSEDDKVSMLERRVAVLEEENRTLRAALAALREIGSSVLRALAGNPQEAAQATGDARPVSDAGSLQATRVKEVEMPTFSFTIRKADNTDLGLDVSSSATQRGLLVEAILPGGAAEAVEAALGIGLEQATRSRKRPAAAPIEDVDVYIFTFDEWLDLWQELTGN